MDVYLRVADLTEAKLVVSEVLERSAPESQYLLTEVKDDRIDGTARPVAAPARQLLVPEALKGTALSIVNATEVSREGTAEATKIGNPVKDLFEVLSSPFVDEQGGEAANDWYMGDFRRQFMWTEIWPVQTFLQRADSESAFDRDVVLRVKVRYYGGISAVDTVYATKVDGA